MADLSLKRCVFVFCLLTSLLGFDLRVQAQPQQAQQPRSQAPSAIGRTLERVPLARWSDLMSRSAEILSRAPQAGLAYAWSRSADVTFGQSDHTIFFKGIFLPAGTWQFTPQFLARLNDGFDKDHKQIRNASLRCQILNFTGVVAEETFTTPVLFHHLQDFDYTVTFTQPVTMTRIVESDGKENSGGVILACFPSANDNSIGMQNLSITAVPLPGVVHKEE